ncbi:MAG: hydroxyacid dehydrogenase [Anaerolineae bacterium]|nr:hydroxyacid dehydrogenase [Anaerolineae bacterium]
MTRRKILYLPPRPLSADILSERARSILESLGQVIWNETDENLNAEQLAELLPGAEAVVTSWGSPAFSPELLQAAHSLRIVGHAAGSVKHLMPKEGYDRGIVVLSAAPVIADSVAEYTLWAMLSAQRDLYKYEHRMKVERGWRRPEDGWGHELYFKRVGIIAASMVGRKVMRLLGPWDCDLVVYDPYLSEEGAAQLGARKVGLEELMSTADIVSVHAPTTPETEKMLRAEHFRSMKDGALIVNNARAWVLDEEALIEELKTGRIRAVLDVFGQEPLPADSPLRDLPNVFLTPHMAGASEESRGRLVEAIAKDMARYFAGEQPEMAVTWQRLQIMA